MSGRRDPIEIAARVDAVRGLLATGLKPLAIGVRLGLTTDQVKGLYRRHIRGTPMRPAPAVSAAPSAVVSAEGCRFPLSEGRPWRFCDRPVDRPGSAWCAQHRRIVYTRAPASRIGAPS